MLDDEPSLSTFEEKIVFAAKNLVSISETLDYAKINGIYDVDEFASLVLEVKVLMNLIRGNKNA